MPKITLDRTIHAGGNVFFKGEAIVSDTQKVLIDQEMERLKEQESEQPEKSEPKKKTRTEK